MAKKTKKAKPSDFTNNPMASVTQNMEHETVARNIMVIMKKEGNDFSKQINWKTYKKHRLADGNFSEDEKYYFDRVMKWCKSADTAKLFSPQWA